MAIFSKGCKPNNFESDNSLKLNFTNIRGLRSNFFECESFLESNFPDILGLCQTNLDDSIDSSSDSLSSVNPKGFYYSYAWCCSLGEGRTSFCTGFISRKFYGFLSFRLALFIVLLFFLQQSASSTSCKVFDSISSNIDQVFSINPSANVFFFGDFILVELIDLLNSFIIFLSQMILLRFLTFLLGSLTVTSTVLLFWIYFYLIGKF